MFRFIETIKYKDGKFFNLSYHNERFNRTRGAFFSSYDDMRLEEEITIPDISEGTIQKCRIIYGKTIEKADFLPIEKRTPSKLRVVIANDILYSYKYEDRSVLTRLFESRGDCDEILIIKNGQVTDSYYSNVVLFDGYDWVTPSAPLLKGTQRAYLLNKGIIKEKNITLESLKTYRKIKLINALVTFEDAVDIDINNLIF